MYGYEYTYEPATEGFFSNIFSKVKNLIDGFSKWLKGLLANIGKLIKKNPRNDDKFSGDTSSANILENNEPNYDSIEIIDAITTNTSGIVVACAGTLSVIIEKFKNGESNDSIRDMFDECAELFDSFDKYSNAVKENLAKLEDIHDVVALKLGYDQLKDLYSENGKFGKKWELIKTVHAFSDDNSKIKPVLGKVVGMYSFAIQSTKALGRKLLIDADTDIKVANTSYRLMKELSSYESAYDETDLVYDPANESAAFTAALVASICSIIVSIVKIAKRISKDKKDTPIKGTFISLNKLRLVGYPKAEAVSEYKKTVKFFRDKGYLDIDKSDEDFQTEIKYEDLTLAGWRFVQGYYEAIGKIDTFTIKKAAESHANTKSIKTVMDFISAIVAIIGLSVGFAMWKPIIFLGLFPTFDLHMAFERLQGMKEFNKNKPTNA